jgi:hypothetical protein
VLSRLLLHGAIELAQLATAWQSTSGSMAAAVNAAMGEFGAAVVVTTGGLRADPGLKSDQPAQTRQTAALPAAR